MKRREVKRMGVSLMSLIRWKSEKIRRKQMRLRKKSRATGIKRKEMKQKEER